MQDIVEYKGWIVAAAFALLFAAEHIWPAVRAGLHPVRRMARNLSFWPLNIALSLAVVLPVTGFAARYPLWDRPEIMGGFAGLAIDIIVLDLFIYAWHRALHRLPFLWRFHEVHHLDEHLDTTSAVRFHSGEIFFAVFVRAAVVIVLAVPFSSVIIFEIMVLVFSLFHHSNAALPPRLERFLSGFVITPSLHWVHHHAVRKDTDSHYGTIFSFWDRIFGSQSRTRRFAEMKIGVEGKADRSFIKLLLLPFVSG